MAEIFTPKRPYTAKASPYGKVGTDPGFLLNEDGTFLLQEEGGKIIIQAAPNYGPFDPYSPKTTPYTPKTA